MSAFSASDAALEGFHVLGRHWRVVVGWAVFNLLAMIAMVIVTVVVTVPVELATGAGSASNMVGVVGAVVAGLGTFAVQIVILTALYRLMVGEGEPEFLYLRIGGDELRVAAILLLLVAAAVPVVLALAGLTAAASKLGFFPALATGVALSLVVYGLAARLALAPVMTFVDGRLRLAAAWRASRGNTLRLIGMTVLAVCLMAVLAVAIWVGLFLLGGALTGFRDFGLSGSESLAAHPGRYVLQLAAELLLAPVFVVLVNAPWVAAYRALCANPR